MAGHRIGQSCINGQTTSCATDKTFLPEAVSARMRKRRCFADTELDAVMLERERAHALLSRRAAVAIAQQPALFRLPVVPYQLASAQLVCRQPNEPAMKLVGLVRSWWTSPCVVSHTDTLAMSSGRGSVTKSSTDNDLNVGRHQPTLPLSSSGLPSTLHDMAASLSAVITAGREDQQMSDHRQDQPSSQTDASNRCGELVTTRRRRDADKEHRLQSLATSKSFNFSVESLLAK